MSDYKTMRFLNKLPKIKRVYFFLVVPLEGYMLIQMMFFRSFIEELSVERVSHRRN